MENIPLLVFAGLLAGAMNAIAGGGTFVSGAYLDQTGTAVAAPTP